MKYEFLLFDLDNTLLDFDLAEDIALTKLIEEQNIKNIEEYKRYYIPINKKLWHQLDNKEITREYLINNRFKLLFNKFGKEVDGKILANRYKQLLSLQGQHINGALELLQKLKLKNYKIYAATNGLIEIQESRLEKSAIKNYFDDIFISEKIGHQKPNLEFFNEISKKIPNLKKERTLMIGDNIFADIKGAINFGIDSAWINFKNEKSNDKIKPTFEINNYIDLEKILL